MSELAPFDARVAGLLSQLQPAARRRLAAEIARRLKASQAQRIAAQRNPDGTPYEPRKPQTRLAAKRGALRRRAMFAKLRTARWMKTAATPDAAVITFAAAVQRMAQVHQYGLRDKVNKSGLMADYPERRLLGLAASEIDDIEDRILDHLAGGLL